MLPTLLGMILIGRQQLNLQVIYLFIHTYICSYTFFRFMIYFYFKCTAERYCQISYFLIYEIIQFFVVIKTLPLQYKVDIGIILFISPLLIQLKKSVDYCFSVNKNSDFVSIC